jgi:hypothetical protein
MDYATYQYWMMVYRIALAIAEMEGYTKPDSVARRNNNPGNLRTWGNRPIVDGFAYFDNIDSGAWALYQQIDKNIKRDLTLNEFFNGKPGVYAGYAPRSDGNDPEAYARFVASKLPGGTPNTRLPSYFWSYIDFF